MLYHLAAVIGCATSHFTKETGTRVSGKGRQNHWIGIDFYHFISARLPNEVQSLALQYGFTIAFVFAERFNIRYYLL